VSYHELGRVAQARQQLDEAEDWLDEAEDWYRKCLITKEELGDKRGLASTYTISASLLKFASTWTRRRTGTATP
jgi:hypothetical protein